MFSKHIASITDEKGIDPRVVAYHEPGSTLVEQYRNIRTYIGSLNGGVTCRSIMVTSANVGEGKSITCVNLALTMAEDKEKNILLVDTNFRAPVIEKLLNVTNDKGLSDYFSGNLRLDEILMPTAVSNLMILPSGSLPTNPANLFSSQKMRELVEELEKHFNYIILDTPALIPFADARIIGPSVDGVLLVVQAGRTRREVILRVQEQIKNVRAKLIGIVLTQVEYYIPDYIHRNL